MRNRVEEIFEEMDTDVSGTVSRQEFEANDILKSLESLGIEPLVLKNAFDILDSDRDGQLESKEFIHMIFKCLHPPKAEDVLDIDSRIDKIAEVVGLGRRALAVLQKDRRKDGLSSE